ncbi:MAG: SIR2 family protein [Bacteroidetes bacterium]|nr:SIR2 family protein [Bacteroidota bacterium]
MDREYNIFVLGAGFSVPAKLPLASDLWQMILVESKKSKTRNNASYTMYDNILQGDIDSFIEYQNSAISRTLKINNEDEINLEEFISYLDIEEHLRLLGSDHWSDAGNQSQILIRNYIAKIIYEQQSKMKVSDQKLYDQFVKLLKPNDLIVTFNYDTLIEDAFERNNIPFRYYWQKFSSVDQDGSGIIDTNNEDIILHKMHGSIDWISDKHFTSKSDLCIWTKARERFSPKRIIASPFQEPNELQYIYRINNLSTYFSLNEPVLESPFIISPSFNKIVYLNPLRELWRGFISNGHFSKHLVFIGFSLPQHDDYIRQPLYYLAKNFESTAKYDNKRISVIDYQLELDKKENFKENYCFLDLELTDYYFDGFSSEVLNKIFNR